MQNKTFKVSLLAMSLGLVNQAWAADLTCSNPTGCSYAFFSPTENGEVTWWNSNGSDSSVNTSLTDSINVTVSAGNYQNVARTENGASEYTPGQYSASSQSLFGVFGGITQNNSLTLKAGVNAILKEDYSASQIIGVHNAKVVLEKGVKLTVEQNYSQIHNIPDAHGLFDNNAAIDIYNSTLDTQADIVLNNKGTDAIRSSSGSNTIISSDHNITMNGEENLAYSLSGKDVATIRNVNVTGNKNSQFVFEIGDDIDDSATVNADNLNVSLNDKSGFMLNAEEGMPTVNLKNSNVKVGYGLLAYPIGDKRTVNLNLQNSTLNATQTLVSVNDKDLPFEDDETVDPTTAELYQLNLTGSQNSKFTGAIIENPDQPAKVEVNLALTDSQWNFNKSSQLNNLTLSNSSVTFEPTSEFKTLTIKGDLSGTGNFTLNTDLAHQQSDKIVVNGKDSGSFGLSVQDSGNEPNAANGSVTLVETQTGTAQFSLLGKDYVDAGAYRYRLNKSGNNWVLSNRSGDNASADNTTNTDNTNNANNNSGNNLVNHNTNQTASNHSGNGGTTANNGSGTNTGAKTEKVALSEQSNALVSLRQAQLLLVEGNLAGLHQRLGELKKGEQGNVWVRNSNHRNKLGSLSVAENAETSGFKQRVNSTQVGADFTATDSIRLGGFVGNARSNVDFEGEYGSGKVRSQTIGLYGTYLADNGFYFDNVVKYERLKSESNRTGERKYNGYTLSSEIGRIHTLGSWTITPQLQAAWTKLSGQDDEERLTALTARAGVRVANQLSLGEWQLQPYAEVNGITTKTNSNTVQVNQYRFDVAESRGRIQTALGVNAALGQHRVGLEGSVTNGKHLDQPYQIQAVYRYSW